MAGLLGGGGNNQGGQQQGIQEDLPSYRLRPLGGYDTSALHAS